MELFGRRWQHQLLGELSWHEVGRAVHTDGHGPVWWGERDKNLYGNLSVTKTNKMQTRGVSPLGRKSGGPG